MRRSNPLPWFLLRQAQEGRKLDLLRSRERANRKRGPSLSIRRGACVEFMCPDCWETITLEVGEPVSIEHRKRGCKSGLTIKNVYKNRAERDKAVLRFNIEDRRRKDEVEAERYR